ncbi:hypothetical protein MSG28_001955 [Choristoneura fumiferana]|uniref:Uncharacterized protein n=1 Tax=Choristoneura fumiferana TaxID=7141 RepID=A0ACC0JTE8_CHOFU|nr:hypothetical protein MSG28_001955 [Choristoneura fumiferana]
MTSAFILSFMFLLTQNLLLNCASAAVHSHSVDTQEREGDGSYRARDFDHYGDSGHNSEFDHEAILGSVKEAEEYDKLSPEESKRRLALLLPKMDVNGDQFIDRNELKEWILNSFRKLSREEAEERMSEADDNRDGVVTWGEYLQDAFGVDAEEEIAPEDTGDTGMLVQEEKVMWHAADLNGDGKLDLNEFEMFTNPEEHELMHGFLVNQTLREKDQNHDGFVDFNEFIGDRGGLQMRCQPRGLRWDTSSASNFTGCLTLHAETQQCKHCCFTAGLASKMMVAIRADLAQGMQQDQSWMVAERDKFDHDLDTDRDGRLDAAELRRWVVPDNDNFTGCLTLHAETQQCKHCCFTAGLASKMVVAIRADLAQGPTTCNESEIATEEVEHLFASADDDGDGRLAFEEVLRHHQQFVGSEATDYGNDLMGEHFDDEL